MVDFMKIGRILLTFCTFILASCLETEDPDTCNRIDTKRLTAINIISRTRVKEIKAVVNQNTLCSNNYELLYVKEKNENLYRLSDIDSLDFFQNKDWFVSSGCYIKNDSVMKNQKIMLQVIKYDRIDVLDIDEFLIGRTSISVILESDTSWFFSHDSSLMADGNPEYNFSISTRKGCHDGYCYVSLPMHEEELCFDD